MRISELILIIVVIAVVIIIFICIITSCTKKEDSKVPETWTTEWKTKALEKQEKNKQRLERLIKQNIQEHGKIIQCYIKGKYYDIKTVKSSKTGKILGNDFFGNHSIYTTSSCRYKIGYTLGWYINDIGDHIYIKINKIKIDIIESNEIIICNQILWKDVTYLAIKLADNTIIKLIEKDNIEGI